MRNALSFDVEEYFHVSNFEGVIARDEWDRLPSRVVESTRRILELLDEHDVHATFFMLGWVAERHPDLVREIATGGHEIASHGYGHRLVYDEGPEAFREDVTRTARLLREITGQPEASYGYRAPSFSITPRSAWALDILAETGHSYDSSIFPVPHPRYGWKGSDPYPHVRQLADGRSLVEMPPTSAPWFGKRLPAAGGAYLRLFPVALLRRGLAAAHRCGHPGILYLHPWEFDPGQPRFEVSRFTAWRHYGNLRGTESRLRRLLEEFEFGTVKEVLPAA